MVSGFLNGLIPKDYYEVFEIHTTPRKGVICLVLRINKKGVIARTIGNKLINIPIGAMCAIISDTEQTPNYARFLPSTKSFDKIHRKVDEIKETLANKNLKITIRNKVYEDINIKNV